jgi:uncharacterized protein (TIGR03437 family)
MRLRSTCAVSYYDLTTFPFCNSPSFQSSGNPPHPPPATPGNSELGNFPYVAGESPIGGCAAAHRMLKIDATEFTVPDIHTIVSAKYLAYVMILTAAGIGPAAAQSWDTSGNGQLNGNYYFREVVWQGANDNANDLQVAGSLYGTISFDGQGHYTLSGAQEYDSSTFSAQPFTLSSPGTFTIAASGYGFIESPLIGATLNVLVSNGVVVGSSTDNGGCTSNTTPCNDLFIATPVPTNASFQGAYSILGVDSPTMAIQDTRAYSLSLTANGTTGSIGTVRLTGSYAFSSAPAADTLSGVTYHFSNGAAVVQFGGELNTNNVDSHFMSGQKYFYFSPDGNFIFGGSPTGWDMLVGVRQGASATLNGLYFFAGMTQDDSPINSGYVYLNSGYGSINVLSSGLELAHQRVLQVAPNGGSPFDYTYGDAVSNSGGVYGDSFTQYLVGPGGGFGIGYARAPGLGIEVLAQAPPTPTGSGPFIYPTGVVNAGSLAPFTASWAPGELVSIFGTNLANATSQNGNLPTTLGGVQIQVTDSSGAVTQAPIYFVSPTQINAVIPVTINPSSSTSATIASIQVVNNGTPSNTVSNYVALTQPGVFNSYTSLAAIQHSDYSMVTSSSPAVPGETLLVYLTGLGQVSASGNSNETFTASIGGTAATVAFSGTQSTVGGGYQMNVTVPSGVTAGNAYLDISGPDSYNSETIVPVSTSGAAVVPQSAIRRPAMPRRAHSTSTSRRGDLVPSAAARSPVLKSRRLQ